MLVEEFNKAGALAVLNDPMIETRLCVSIKPDAVVERFVQDTVELDVNGNIFKPVPFAKFSSIVSGNGAVPDTGSITLDGKDMLLVPPATPETVIEMILEYPLRDRPIQIGLIVLNVDTKAVIGLIPQFVGFVDNAAMRRDDGEGPILEMKIASFRAYAQRRVARTYSDTDHQTRFPGDRAAKWISDTVFRRGKYAWNSNSATGSGSNTGGGRGRPYDTPNIDFHLR